MSLNIRTTRPTSGNKYYNTKSAGGYSSCIKGKPTDKQCNVLSNCVGNACAGFNEEHNFGYEKYHLTCNAENFIEMAIASGLSVYKDPMPGGILVWQKGTLKSSDGAGHVEIAISILEWKNGHPSKIRTHSSGYGSSNPWWTSIRSIMDGNWGTNSPYKYRGCIAPKNYKPVPITPTVPRDTTKNQLETLRDMNVRTDIETTSPSLGIVPAGNIYNYYEEKQGKSSKWYAITEDKSQWIAGVNNNGTKYCAIYPAEPKPVPPEPPKPTPTELKVGDKVKIIGKGNGDSYGTSNTAYGIGWTREILKIYSGRPYPYRVGNKTGTTGFYKAEALEKL